MESQLVLLKEKKKNANLEADAELLVSTLRSRKRWIKAIRFKVNYDWSPRYTRLLAAMSGGRVISGNKGYKAVDCAELDEVSHFINKTYQVVKELAKRASSVSAYYHTMGKQK